MKRIEFNCLEAITTGDDSASSDGWAGSHLELVRRHELMISIGYFDRSLLIKMNRVCQLEALFVAIGPPSIQRIGRMR